MDELLIGWIGIIKCAFKSAIIPRNSRLTYINAIFVLTFTLIISFASYGYILCLVFWSFFLSNTFVYVQVVLCRHGRQPWRMLRSVEMTLQMR